MTHWNREALAQLNLCRISPCVTHPRSRFFILSSALRSCRFGERYRSLWEDEVG
jgi:hypothetical protein